MKYQKKGSKMSTLAKKAKKKDDFYAVKSA
jgi:hypothetical protein